MFPQFPALAPPPAPALHAATGFNIPRFSKLEFTFYDSLEHPPNWLTHCEQFFRGNTRLHLTVFGSHCTIYATQHRSGTMPSNRMRACIPRSTSRSFTNCVSGWYVLTTSPNWCDSLPSPWYRTTTSISTPWFVTHLGSMPLRRSSSPWGASRTTLEKFQLSRDVGAPGLFRWFRVSMSSVVGLTTMLLWCI